MAVTATVTVASLMLLVDLLLVGHTHGEQIWGPITAGLGAGTGMLSLAFLVVHGRRRAARLTLNALWLTVAFFGYGGLQSHRTAGAGGEVSGPPPLAPLVFTGLGIAGALILRYGNKED